MRFVCLLSLGSMQSSCLLCAATSMLRGDIVLTTPSKAGASPRCSSPVTVRCTLLEPCFRARLATMLSLTHFMRLPPQLWQITVRCSPTPSFALGLYSAAGRKFTNRLSSGKMFELKDATTGEPMFEQIAITLVLSLTNSTPTCLADTPCPRRCARTASRPTVSAHPPPDQHCAHTLV